MRSLQLMVAVSAVLTEARLRAWQLEQDALVAAATTSAAIEPNVVAAPEVHDSESMVVVRDDAQAFADNEAEILARFNRGVQRLDAAQARRARRNAQRLQHTRG